MQHFRHTFFYVKVWRKNKAVYECLSSSAVLGSPLHGCRWRRRRLPKARSSSCPNNISLHWLRRIRRIHGHRVPSDEPLSNGIHGNESRMERRSAGRDEAGWRGAGYGSHPAWSESVRRAEPGQGWIRTAVQHGRTQFYSLFNLSVVCLAM